MRQRPDACERCNWQLATLYCSVCDEWLCLRCYPIGHASTYLTYGLLSFSAMVRSPYALLVMFVAYVLIMATFVWVTFGRPRDAEQARTQITYV